MTPQDEMLSAYADGQLDAEETTRTEAALAADPALRAQLEALVQLKQNLAALPLPAPQPQLRVAAVQQLSPKAKPLFRLWWLAPASTLALVVAMIAAWPARSPTLPPEALSVAQDLDLLESYEVLGLGSADDVDVIAHLTELETP